MVRQAEVAQLRLEMVELTTNQTSNQKELEEMSAQVLFYQGQVHIISDLS